jgi:cyclic beta-1,2-glucan glucanotransferase
MLKEAPPQPAEPKPIDDPAQLFSQDQLEAYAARLALTYRLTDNPRRGRPLLPRLDESAERLDAAYAFLSTVGRGDTQPVASEQWLRDNHHVVQDQVREIRQDLPRRYYQQLPKLADGPFQGYPRIYVLARELIGHTAGRIDFETITDFVIAYQRSAPLSIGETWAVPIMLRLALIEELRRLADGVVAARESREKARKWHEAHPDAAEWTPRAIRKLLDEGRHEDGHLPAPFVLELLQWLRDQPSTAAPAWQALQRGLQEQGDSADEMLRLEHQHQAEDQLAISNVITSMRRASAIDWTLFFERVSVVEQILRDDPAGAYGAMDFSTRDRYRHSIEQLAFRARKSEPAIAQRAIELARAAIEAEPQHDRQHHVGYYLISRGRLRLEREVGYPAGLRERLARFVFRHPAIGYLGLIAITIAVTVASFLIYAARHGASGAGLWLVAVAVLLPVSELVISLLNLIITAQVQPRPLPKLAMRDGIPASDRTTVVVPTIVESEARLDALFDDLEVRFLANRDPHLHFGLLADFPDAHEASRPADDAILARAQQRVDELNARHGVDRFFYFHRERRWNPGEGLWMGWERKRGKLAEFNRLLRGATDTSFIVTHGNLALLQSARFVITLDSDTQLPLEAGRRLVGTLAHPLNRPRFDHGLGRVTQGYGVLQPSIGVDVVSATRTAFAKVFSGHVGVDPYTTAVSDVYQDLFHEGSYVGKGIYDIDAFEASLANRVPENALLSHDLFEGVYARAGLCTDIHLIDDYPPQYLAFAARQHRWVRGDWQIVRWLWRTVPDAARHAVPNSLPAIARWKILDNLRRSLLPIALVGLLAAGWTILPGSALMWTVLAVLVLAFPAYVQVARSLGSRVRGVRIRDHIAAERDNLITSARQSFLSATFLAHQACLMTDAISRTLWRLLMSGRRRLEWVSAYQAARINPSAAEVARQMWAAPALAITIGVLVAADAPARLLLALPMIALWIASPVIAYGTGQPLSYARQVLGLAERAELRKVARKTWRFFEDLVGPADHWLVPDNIQEDRKELVAHRTSPTNIGLQLIATLGAGDLGYLSFCGVIDRLEPTFATLLKLPRYHGHFYNWYDTGRLVPLSPAYISTVDSGNLTGYLLTLKSALPAAVARTPVIDAAFLSGLDDVVRLFEDSLSGVFEKRSGARRAFGKELSELRQSLQQPPARLQGWRPLLDQLTDRIAALGVLLHEVEEQTAANSPEPQAVAEAAVWLERANIAIAQRMTDLDRLVPWAAAIDELALDLRAPGSACSLADLIAWSAASLPVLQERHEAPQLHAAIARSQAYAEELVERALRLAELADDFVEETEFGFLFDRERQLFSIGYSVSEGRLDSSYYDTLASEARLASFVAIALGQIPQEHWFKLGRSLTPTGGARALLSWSASMFEYFMPLLVMRAYPGTLLDETYRAVIDRQIHYAAQRGVPWGISESAYNAQDLELNYQYRAFGVPGLGLKRGLADDLVIAPYATILAAPIVPLDAVHNLERLAREGAVGRYGYYESIDYTPDRQPLGQHNGVVLPTYMAHHQGMSLVALDNAINDAPMQQRFHAEPRVQAADLLLQERVPRLVPLQNPPMEIADHVPSPRTAAPSFRRYSTAHTLSPRSHLLSNGSYVVMVTNAGGGYSRRQHIALTRWREDVTTDAWGSFCYICDRESGALWSTGYQPTGREPDEYEVIFAPDKAVFRRVDGEIETRTEIVVSPEDEAELRRVSITNHGLRPRSLDVASYAEVVLAPADADLAHPAFSSLFVETTSVPQHDAIICARRPRTGTDRLYLIHVMSGRGPLGAASRHETDRARFVGRGRTLDRPAALRTRDGFSNTTGAVLDPVVSLAQSIRLPPGATARVAFTTGYAETEADAHRLIEKYSDRRAVARALALASMHSQIELRHLNLTVDDTTLFQRFAGRLISGDSRLRAVDAIAENRQGQRDLWKYGISGDIPIVLARVADGTEVPLIVELLKAHEYLRLKGLAFDLVILNEHPASYLQELQHLLQQLVDTSPAQPWIDRPGGVFLRRSDLMPQEDQLLLRAAARAVMDAAQGGLRNQLSRPQRLLDEAVWSTVDEFAQRTTKTVASPPIEPELELPNGFGGFTDDGREYVIHTDALKRPLPPSPWTNVVAQPQFGFACTETGCGYTWSINSHENRLTPWRNDPVSDQPGEVVFIRDEETGAFWSATPLPASDREAYITRHGQGYSVFEHTRSELGSELVLFVSPDEPIKFFRITLRNLSSRRRRCSVTLYVEWVLGENRSRTSAHIVTKLEPATGAVTARNVFRQEFGSRVAFLDLSEGHTRSITGDRTEFIGRNGSLARAAAQRRVELSDRVGAAFDPCGAIRVRVDLGPGDEQVLIGVLGDAEDESHARHLVERYRYRDVVDEALSRTTSYWNDLLGVVNVRTPDRAMDLMLNRWLLYQTLACRVWGRSAFYQSSGAFGFRDQLQDTLALLLSAPGLVRDHLLHAASRQFLEGDVQHWWHEPGGQGVRTRFSDDRLWLIYATLQYVAATGDEGVLDEVVPYLSARPLNPDEHEIYDRPPVANESGTLYDHCLRAMDVSLSTGAHGLPLMGTGDWNDGMSLVGAGGKGESVWLGWFLVSLLHPFADIVAKRGDHGRADEYRRHADALASAIELSWDGEWYRRAYFDDGTPLGSRHNTECQIDAIAQSWAVLSGASHPDRARQAMQAVDERLVRRKDRLILLLTPPFDRMTPSPGYIQGYLPGVRENGGQYTHAALWNVLAFARLGDGDRAAELFSILNPVNHARTSDDVQRYRAEPYVVAADVYSVAPHTGRGGWTWYTGSAGWMYRIGIEALLGISLRRGALHIDPCIPRAWPRYEVTFKPSRTPYHIVVENPEGVSRGVKRIEVDGVDRTGQDIPIADDGAQHSVRVIMGSG